MKGSLVKHSLFLVAAKGKAQIYAFRFLWNLGINPWKLFERLQVPSNDAPIEGIYNYKGYVSGKVFHENSVSGCTLSHNMGIFEERFISISKVECQYWYGVKADEENLIMPRRFQNLITRRKIIKAFFRGIQEPWLYQSIVNYLEK